MSLMDVKITYVFCFMRDACYGRIGARRAVCTRVPSGGVEMFGQIVQDFRHASRVFKRSKGLALGVVISMGFGLGATASMFSLADFFVFRPVSVPQTERLVRITNTTAASSLAPLSYLEYQDYVERNHSF